MKSLISVNQSAFIEGRSMHGNFLFVRNNARRYHRMKRPVLVFNLDIMKAFDSIRWDYLMALLQQHGFPPRWRKWVGALLSTSTSQVVLIGIPGHRIQHGKGLWQGDPLSALLFILALTHCKVSSERLLSWARSQSSKVEQLAFEPLCMRLTLSSSSTHRGRMS